MLDQMENSQDASVTMESSSYVVILPFNNCRMHLTESLNVGSLEKTLLNERTHDRKSEVCTSMTFSISWPKWVEEKVVWLMKLVGRGGEWRE